MPYSQNGDTIYYYGESALERRTTLKSRYGTPQEFPDIFNNALDNKNHFKDPEFPHDDHSVGDFDSLFDTAKPKMLAQVNTWKENGWNGSATWIRIADLCSTIYHQTNTPCFNCGDVGKTIARFDVLQGCTGDCWFLASISSVSMVPALINNVVPSDNSTNDQGVYHFLFWYQGAWVDVAVDDYLPCIVTNDETFTIGSNFYPNNGKAEFWPMLLEKAYAKLNESYTNIAANIIMIGLESLTGGFGEYIDLTKHVPSDGYETLLKWFDRGCVVGAGTSTGGDGIVGNHAYSVTGAHVVTTYDGTEHKLVRCRNPWGNHEWLGHWRDNSSLWEEVSDDQKEKIGFHVKEDGEFWMSYDDFLTHFSDADACFYYDSNAVNQSGSKHFAQFDSRWSVDAGTAGGFHQPWQNPIFEVELGTSNETGLLVVGLLVKTRLKDVNMKHGNCIRIFPADGATTFDEKFFKHNDAKEIYPAGETKVPGNSTSSYSRAYHLVPGKYVIIPSALDADQENQFLVRIYSEGKEAAFKLDGGSANASANASASASGSEEE